MQSDSVLRLGDEVLWRGGFGRDVPRLATVKRIEVTPGKRQKYGGREVQWVEWKTVNANRVVVDLDNGHWAYGEQIMPKEAT